MKICKVYPTRSDCVMYVDTLESLSGDISQTPDCRTCCYNTQEYRFIDFVNGLFNTYALLEYKGKIEKVSISRIHDIREVPDTNEVD